MTLKANPGFSPGKELRGFESTSSLCFVQRRNDARRSRRPFANCRFTDGPAFQLGPAFFLFLFPENSIPEVLSLTSPLPRDRSIR